MGVGRRTREEMVKWNQMTALRFQTGGRHQTSLASFWEDRCWKGFDMFQRPCRDKVHHVWMKEITMCRLNRQFNLKKGEERKKLQYQNCDQNTMILKYLKVIFVYSSPFIFELSISVPFYPFTINN